MFNPKKKSSMGKRGEKSFLDLNVSVFVNKNNGQWSVSIPKKKLKRLRMEEGRELPKKIPIRLFKWWK
jgi:hypothetical protein